MNTPSPHPSASIAGLLAFIASQPADRPIVSHRSWKQCAVGDYAREALGHDIPNQRDHGGDYRVVRDDPVMLALYAQTGTSHTQFTDEHPDLLALKENETLMDFLASMSDESTYGAVNENVSIWLKTRRPDGEWME